LLTVTESQPVSDLDRLIVEARRNLPGSPTLGEVRSFTGRGLEGRAFVADDPGARPGDPGAFPRVWVAVLRAKGFLVTATRFLRDRDPGLLEESERILRALEVSRSYPARPLDGYAIRILSCPGGASARSAITQASPWMALSSPAMRRGFATDLVFLSHAKALAPGSSFSLSSRRAGRRQLLATEGTLVLLGAAGERLRARTLPAGFGRAFNLGGLRLALVPAGYLPGAASLLCEAGGRRLLYAGTICRERAFASLGAAEVRSADAVCLDATFGDPRFVLPPREEAEATLRRFVEGALAARRAPVLLVSPFGPAPATGRSAAGCRHRRARSQHHRGALARFAQAGAAVPTLRRFAGKLGATRHCFWPPEAREAPVLGALDSPAFAFVSGFSVERHRRRLHAR